MRINRTRPTSIAKRHLVLILALVCGAVLSAFSALPGGRAGAQAQVNDLIAFDRNGELLLINSNGTGLVSRGQGFGPSFSPDGTQMAFAFKDTVETNIIYKMNADGTNRLQLTDSYQEYGAAWSPDGSQIAFVSEREDPEYPPGDDLHATQRIYLMDSNGNGEQKLMMKSQNDFIREEFSPAWSPDGSKLAFIGHSRNSSGSSRTNIYVVTRFGADLREVTHFDGPSLAFDNISWSHDGTKIAFTMQRDIHVVNVDGLSAPVNITNTSNRDETDPAFSPGGKRIAYVVNDFTDNTKDGLYVMKADGQDQTQVLSSFGTGQQVSRPTWNPLAQDPNEEPTPTPTPTPTPPPSPSPSPKADISITLSALPVQPKVGDNVTYSLVIKNNGPTNVDSSFANFSRSQSLNLVSATVPQGTCQTVQLGTTCATGALASGASKTVTIVVRPTAVGEVGIAGTVGSPLLDENQTNNSRTVNVTVTAAGPCVPEVTAEVQQLILRPGSQTQRRVRHLIFVRNTTGRTLNGLVHFVFDGLHSSISDGDPRSTFFNTRCAQPLGRPYTSVGVRDLVWRPGQIIPIEVEFFNPDRVRVNYRLRIYTGPGFP